MAEQQETIFIDVQFDSSKVAKDLSLVTARIASMKEQSRELKKAIEEGKDADGQMSAELARLSKEIAGATSTQKALQGQLQQTMDANEGLGDSFREMDAQLRQLENQYKSLSSAQRQSAEGQALKQAIIQQKQALKDFDAELGNYQRNVGNYSGGILEASQKMGGLGRATTGIINPIKNATGAMKAMAATPLLAIVNILVTVFFKLQERMQKNTAAMESVTKAFSLFNGIGVIVDKLIDGIAKGVAWLADKLYALADSFGLVSAEMKEAQAIGEEEIAIQEAQRKAAEDAAEAQIEIARLRAEAANKEKYTAAERAKMLQEAANKEEDIFKIRYDIAKREYELQARKNAQSESSQDEMKKESDLRVAMLNAERDYYNKQRELNAQLSAAQKSAAADREAAQKKREEDSKRLTELEKRQQDELVKLQQEAEDLRIAAITDGAERAYQARKVEGEREIKALKQRLATDTLLTDEAKSVLNDIIKSKESALQNDLQKIVEEGAKQRTATQTAKEREVQLNLLNLRKETLKKGSEELLAIQLEILDIQERQELEKYAEGSEERLLLEEQFQEARAELQRTYREAQMQEEMQFVQQTLGQLQGLNSAINALQTAELNRYKQQQDAKRKALDKRLAAGEISEIEYNQEVQRLDAETAEKEKTLQIEQAKREKALGIMSAVINTAAAIIGFLAKPGGIPGIVLSALAAATGAAQIATIAAEPLPAMAGGGVVGGGKYSDGDTQLVRLSPQEMVLNPSQQAQLFDMANGGGSGNNYEMMRAAMTEAVAAQPAPVMVYSEFEEFGENVARYNELAKI